MRVSRQQRHQSDLNTQAVHSRTKTRPPPIAIHACAVAMWVSTVDLNAGYRGIAPALGLGAIAVQSGLGARRTALRHHIARALLAATALRGHTQLQLDVVKVHAGLYMLGNFAIRHFAANTNNHVTKPQDVGV